MNQDGFDGKASFGRFVGRGQDNAHPGDPHLDPRLLDQRLVDAIRKFARAEIPLFATPSQNVEDAEAMEGPVLRSPSAPESFKRLAVNLALHRLDTPTISFDDAFIDAAPSGYAIDGAAVAVGDEPIIDVETAMLATMEACESDDLADSGGRPLRPRLVLVRAICQIDAPLNEIEKFGQDAQRALMRHPDEISDHARELGRIAHFFAAMRAGARRVRAGFAPQIDLVFAFCGAWKRSARTDAAIAVRLADLRATMPNADIRFQIWGAEELIRAYERVALASVGILREARLMPLPVIRTGSGPTRGWLGYVPALSIARLILAPDNTPDPRLFYDNIRHYLGDNARTNPGAAGLSRTLEKGEGAEVLLRHNGLTIVARGAEFEDNGDGEGDLILREFQIVNGAQTAFTLFAQRNRLDGAYMPVKIVVTEDERVKDGVVLGANTQSAVDRFDMLARRPELRALQHAFEAMPPSAPEKLWLQRRRDEPIKGRVHRHRIFTPRQLMEGFAATIRGQPHRVHDNAPVLLDEIPDCIFHIGHEPMAYLSVGWLIVAGRRWAERHDLRWADRMGVGRPDAYPARFQFLYALYRLVDPEPDSPQLAHGPVADARYRRMTEVFATRDGARLADLSGVIVREAAAGKPLSRDLVRRASFTEEVRLIADDAHAQMRGDSP